MTLDEIKTIGIVGAGQMGRGIGHVFAATGFDVLLVDVAESRLTEALGHIRTSLARAVERGGLTDDQAKDLLTRIHPTVGIEQLAKTQLVIEAIPEDPTLKQNLFAHLGRICKPQTILASNTSSISITMLGAAAGRPDRVVGLHFMNPAPVMRLVEIVRGRETSEHTMQVAIDLVKRLDKISVVSRDAPGFIVNRILMPMINEAIVALEEGIASAEDIDLAMTAGTNHPIGPLALADRIGLDTVLAICEVLCKDLDDPKFRPAPLLRRYVAAGRLGRKTGHGFYDYEPSHERHEATSSKF